VGETCILMMEKDSHMGWHRFVGSLQRWVFAKEPYKHRDVFCKRDLYVYGAYKALTPHTTYLYSHGVSSETAITREDSFVKRVARRPQCCHCIQSICIQAFHMASPPTRPLRGFLVVCMGWQRSVGSLKT